MKKIIFSIILGSTLTSFGQTIAAARAGALGSSVTFRGVSVNGPNQIGTIRYIQDGTGAMPIYGTAAALANIASGDSVLVTGTLVDFNGLLEISPITTLTEVSVSTIPAPLELTISQFGEPFEAQLIRVQNVTFQTTGSFAANMSYNFTDGANTGVLRVSTGFALIGSPIPTGAVTITGVISQFNTAFQILARGISDIVPFVAAAREINVSIGGTTLLTGASYNTGVAGTDIVAINNSGSSILNVSNAVISGTNAADFVLNYSVALAIASGATSNLNLVYTPGGTGTRTAILTITNDDSDENPFIVNLSGPGTDNLATEPSANPTNLTFPNIKAYTVTGSFIAVPSATNYLVVWKKGSAPTGVPVDATTYQRGDIVGDGFVASVGSTTNFVPRGIRANTQYFFKIFAFNGAATSENYLTTSPLSGSVTSTGSLTGATYSGLTASNPNFVTSLSALVNPHTVISYVAYKSTLMANFELLDTTQGRSLAVCVYSGERKIVIDPFDWVAANFSREHTYCHSWMPSFPADSPAKPEYSDQHNLYPTNQNDVNQIRSNYPLGVITGAVTSTYLDGTLGVDGFGQLVYEPKDSHKGNAARAIFYMAIAYNGISGQNWQLTPNQGQDILKTWHFADLPDNYEIARNEYIASIQNNRNPFIDSVDYVCHINFSNMTHIVGNCGSAPVSGVGLDEISDNNLVIYPNPASDDIYVQVNGMTLSNITILDVTGKVVMNENYSNLPMTKLDARTFAKGVYVMQVTTKNGTTAQQFVVK